MPSAVPLNLHLSLLNHFLQGAAYPVGGSSEIAFHLCRVIQEGGGAVLVRAPVRRIVLDAASSSVTGVVVDKGGGVLVRAPVVVSDAGVFNTFNELLPLEPGRPLAGAAGVAAANYLKHVRHGLGGFQASRRGRRCLHPAPPPTLPVGRAPQVFVGLDGSAAELGIGAQNMWAFSSPHLEEALAAYLALEEPTPAALEAHDVPLIFISFPSAKVRARGGRPVASPAELGPLLADLPWRIRGPQRLPPHSLPATPLACRTRRGPRASRASRRARS